MKDDEAIVQLRHRAYDHAQAPGRDVRAREAGPRRAAGRRPHHGRRNLHHRRDDPSRWRRRACPRARKRPSRRTIHSRTGGRRIPGPTARDSRTRRASGSISRSTPARIAMAAGTPRRSSSIGSGRCSSPSADKRRRDARSGSPRTTHP
jgi:hypothetical protein